MKNADAPADTTDTTAAVRIAHLGDPHMIPAGGLLYGTDPGERLTACLAHLAARHADVRACVLCGDLASHGEAAAYTRLKGLLERLPVPCHPVLGNHDDFSAFARVFPERRSDLPGFLQYEADAAGVRLLVLDTRDVSGGAPKHAGLLCARRLAWLRERLADGAGPVLIAMHHPPVRVGIPSMDAIALQEPEVFHAAAVSGRAVPFLLLGHLHRSLAGVWRGLPFACAAGLNHHIALDLRRAAPVPGSSEPPSCNLILVDGESVTAHRVGFAEEARVFPLDD